MGRLPENGETLRLRGSWRAKKTSAPAITAGDPTRPEWLTPEASGCWDELLPILRTAGVLSPAYCIAVGMLAESLAHYQLVLRSAASAPLVSLERPHPLQRLVVEASGQLLAMLCQFGLTPRSVRQVQRLAEPVADELARYRLHP